MICNGQNHADFEIFSTPFSLSNLVVLSRKTVAVLSRPISLRARDRRKVSLLLSEDAWRGGSARTMLNIGVWE